MKQKLISRAQAAINKLEGQEVYYLGSICRVEKGILYDTEQDALGQIDLYAMSESELKTLISELEEKWTTC